GPWDVSASATLIQPEQRSGENKGNRLARRATESLRVDVDRKLGDFSVGGSLIAQGDRYNSADNDVALPGYGLLNLRAGWSPAPRWSARLTVDNVLDKDFVTARSPDEFDYQNAGRTAFLSIRYGSR
ncbi:MAG: TonB-dependent receptor, partial [Ectothiorhodospiraceae bacterium]